MNVSINSPIVRKIAQLVGALGGAGLASAFFGSIVVVTNSYLIAILVWLVYIIGTLLTGAAGAVAGSWLYDKAVAFAARIQPLAA